MTEYYLASFTAIVALLSSYLTHKMTMNRAKLQFEIEHKYTERKEHKNKLEELYLLVNEWATSLGSLHIPLISVMKNEISYDVALDFFIEEIKNKRTNFDKLEMMIDLNFHELKDEYLLILQKRDKISKIVDAHKKDCNSGNINSNKYLNPFLKSQEEFYQQVELFKDSISKYSYNFNKSI